MNNIKIFKDSKELPIWNYKRILQTGDFLYMIVGYDGHEAIEYDLKELENKFNYIQSQSAFDINEKNEELSVYSSVERNKLQMLVFGGLNDIISLKQKQEFLCDQLKQEFSLNDLFDLLSEFKIKKSKDLNIQKEIILEKIQKLENHILSDLQKIKTESKDDSEFDIDEQIINVKIGLEMDFDEKTTSLHQYQIYIKALLKKIEQLNKINAK